MDGVNITKTKHYREQKLFIKQLYFMWKHDIKESKRLPWLESEQEFNDALALGFFGKTCEELFD